MKKYILLSGLMAASSIAFAQEEFDALKYSLADLSGSARYVSMSGAFGALGGDMTTLGMNPAGIAVFRTSELSITPSLSSTSAKSLFNGYNSKDSKMNLLINNFGYVGSFRTYEESAISNFNFGISYNKVKDYNRNVSVIGKDHSSSLLRKICNDQNNESTKLYKYANETWLADKNAVTGVYESILNDGEKVDNSMYMMESGGIDEWNFSLGANYGHILYMGMSLGVQNIDYELKTVYGEDFKQGGAFELRNVLTTQGSGVNLKVGAIVRPVPELRLGFAFHSPTYYSMTDVFGTSMSSFGIIDPATHLPFNPDPYYATEGDYADYQLKTPSMLMYSAAYQFGQKGLVSIDWDVVDYGETALKDADGKPYSDTNGKMSNDFRAASNLRLGAEYRLTDNISLRGGAAWYQSPVHSTLEKNNTPVKTSGTTPQYGIEKDTYYLSCGLGYRTGGFFLDAALQRQMRNENFYNYYDGVSNPDYSKYSELTTNKTNLIVSLGFKF